MRKILNEQLDITDAHPLKARFYDYKNFTYPWHFHSEFEVIYIEKGYGLGMAGDGMTDFSATVSFRFQPSSLPGKRTGIRLEGRIKSERGYHSV